MVKPDKQSIYRSLGKEHLLAGPAIKDFTDEERKKVELIRPILMNVITGIIEEEYKRYLATIYEQKP